MSSDNPHSPTAIATRESTSDTPTTGSLTRRPTAPLVAVVGGYKRNLICKVPSMLHPNAAKMAGGRTRPGGWSGPLGTRVAPRSESIGHMFEKVRSFIAPDCSRFPGQKARQRPRVYPRAPPSEPASSGHPSPLAAQSITAPSFAQRCTPHSASSAPTSARRSAPLPHR
jgi:hypothetical protein